jgi:acyl carrier protein
MYEFVEPHLRALVAAHLGLSLEAVVCEVLLRDELAAGSLDLVELSLALEAEFAIALPNGSLDRVRTYSDLVDAIGLLIRSRWEAGMPLAETPARMWVRITPPDGGSGGTLERSGWLTPYHAETIADDALRAGDGATLEMAIAASSAAALARVQRQFAPLSARGVRVTVRRDDEPGARAEASISVDTHGDDRRCAPEFPG